MKSLGKIKRGDTFSFTAQLKDSISGDLLSGIADNLRCQGRTKSDRLVTEMTISELDSGAYLFAAPTTDNWSAGFPIFFDIEYAKDGITSSSETFFVDVEADITYD